MALREDVATELYHFYAFMRALREQFEDQLTVRRAKTHIRTIKQEKRMVAEYIQEFGRLASQLGECPECLLMAHF